MEKNQNKKSRHWNLILYPESVPPGWEDILAATGVQFAYILHDKDIWTEEDMERYPGHVIGSPKKPHYHVILKYDGPTTFQRVKSLAVQMGTNKDPQITESLSGSYRYMTHGDYPHKYQYPVEDIKVRNGFRLKAPLEESAPSHLQKRQLLMDLLGYCESMKIYSFSVLVDRLKNENLVDLWDIAVSKYAFVKAYLDDRRRTQDRWGN